MKPDMPPTILPGMLASETSSAYWVAVNSRLVSPDRNATSTTPAYPSARLSPDSAATNAQVSLGFIAISRYSRLDSDSPSAPIKIERRMPSAATDIPPRNAPAMPIQTPYNFDTVAISALL